MNVRAALDGVARSLEAPGISCSVVDLSRVDDASPIVASAARLSAGRRRLFADRDAEWSEIAAATGPDARPAWLACEPVTADDGSAIGALVVAGASGASTDVLAMAPRVAAACAPLLVGLRFSRKAAELVHGMNNQVAATLLNVELALDIVVNQQGGGDPSELVRALGFARKATKTLKAQLGELAELAPRVRGERDTV